MKLFIFILLLISGLFSCTQPTTPEVITVQAPVSISYGLNPDSCLLFLLQKNKLFYLDHLNGNKSDTTEILPYTKENVIRTIDSLEQKYHIKMVDYEKFLLVKGGANFLFPSFKILKEAFKQKEIYKFRIVTTGE